MSPVEYRTHFSLSKNSFFDRLTEVKEATKTSNSTPKCMRILERGAMGALPGAEKAT